MQLMSLWTNHNPDLGENVKFSSDDYFILSKTLQNHQPFQQVSRADQSTSTALMVSWTQPVSELARRIERRKVENAKAVSTVWRGQRGASEKGQSTDPFFGSCCCQDSSQILFQSLPDFFFSSFSFQMNMWKAERSLLGWSQNEIYCSHFSRSLPNNLQEHYKTDTNYCQLGL